MAKKIYAVKKGREPGIYYTWAECQNQINGFSGAEYRGFLSLDEAECYLKETKKNNSMAEINAEEPVAIAYVDGSYDETTNRFSSGVVFFWDNQELHFSRLYDDKLLADMNNVAGEIKAAEIAMQYCIDNQIKSLKIYHDYEGIAKWCTGEWKAKKTGTQEYKNFFDSLKGKLTVEFIKVKGHSGDKFNDLADQLAKEAFSLEVTPIIHDTVEKEKTMAKRKSIFIDRDKINDMILEIGNEEWSDFTAEPLKKVGNQYRCNICAEGKKAILDFYFNNDGTTTIFPTGINIDISSVIRVKIEEKCQYRGELNGKTYSFKNLSTEWAEKLIDYLSSLEGVDVETTEIRTAPEHKIYKFSSKIGDRLTINHYATGTVTLQGKPAYLYGEAISLLSYCKDVSVDDIVNTVNSFHEVNIGIDEVRNEMETLLPHAYGNIDDMILKLLSPSISLRRVQIPLEDYSCYAFSALRALEGYIKYLLNDKGVVVGNSFGAVFNGTSLLPKWQSQIADITYQQEIERLYQYLRGNRHVIFHVEQVLIGTHILEDKREADEIVNNVLNLIETSYTNING